MTIADGGELRIADGGEVKITAGVACVPEKPTLLWPGLSFQFVDFRTILISFFFFFCKKKSTFSISEFARQPNLDFEAGGIFFEVVDNFSHKSLVSLGVLEGL